jgi:5-bromo-4-chloroindolyl phosphate hydrolysis protein
VTERDLAHLRAHQRNVDRYVRLLRTQLSDHERRYIENRLAEARAVIAGSQLETESGHC